MPGSEQDLRAFPASGKPRNVNLCEGPDIEG